MIRFRLLPLLALLLSCLTSGAQSLQLRMEEVDPQTRMPAGWAAGIGKGTSGIRPGARLSADAQLKQEGKRSLSLSSGTGTGDEFLSVVYSIRKKVNGGQIRLKGFMKTEGVKGTAGLWMRIDGRDNTLAFDNMQSRPVSGNTEWTEYEIELPYDREEAESIHVGALLSGTGRIWIDNFRVTVDGKDIQDAPAYAAALLPAQKDTAYRKSSGTNTISLTPEKVQQLASLGMLWGFIKYYHQGVQAGNHNMDAALFRVLPLILAAKDDVQAAEFMERWVDMFGKPAPCSSCRDAGQVDEAALQPDYGRLFRQGDFPPSLRGKLEYIRANRYPGGQKHYYIDMHQGVGNPQFRNEDAYSEVPYPDAGIRLLALYRYWNYIRYFFPYRHLMGEDWEGVLTEAIPEFCNARDTADYQLAFLRLIGRVDDTHANLWGNPRKLQELKGMLIMPFYARFIDDRLVVTGYYKDTLNIRSQVRPGDVIESIDSVPVSDLVKRYLPLTPASNYETQLRDMASAGGFLLRSNEATAAIRIAGEGRDKSKELTVQRVPLRAPARGEGDPLFRPEKGYSLLPDNIGYIYPALLTNNSLDSVKALLGRSKGLIIDLRCYPTTFMPFTYGAWLKPRASAFARFTTGSTDLPGLFVKTPAISNGKDNMEFYTGKVVIIVNEKTQSQAEYTTMALQTVPGAVTIGSTTAGADGNVSEIVLPGGLRTMISGIGVLYPDGTETQRKGVKIDRVIRPTIRGIREGRDELLEAAVRIIR
jgi:hypothetical protein